MLFKKFSVSPAAKKAFGLFRDPMSDDAVNTPDDVFLSPGNRYVYEAMLDTCRNGGFRAVIGESGAGKTTIRHLLAERLRADQEPVILIEPYVLGMEHSDITGKTLKSGHIAEAIIRTLSPDAVGGHSLEKRFDAAHRLLRASLLAGNKHVLVIEEAHGLPTPTLKHLKRWAELREGMRRLLSILLIGQPELRVKLSGANAEVREVVQRCEQCELEPLDAHLEQFIKHKFARVGADAGKVIDPHAYLAIVERLTHAGRDGLSRTSFSYPLAVSNLIAGALNLAASLGIPTVTADVIRRV